MQEDVAWPTTYRVDPNYPNPFRTTTRIRYGLPQAASVLLALYDLQGRRITVIEEGNRPAGWHQIHFDAGGLPSGVYVYRFEAGSYRTTGHMVLLQ